MIDPASALGSYHKGLNHDQFGEVGPADFAALVAACNQPNFLPDVGLAFENLPPNMKADRLANPLAAWATGDLGPLDFSQIHLRKPPDIKSVAMAAEMTELYWMALLRDEPFAKWSDEALKCVADEIEDLVRKGAQAGDLSRGVGEDHPLAVTPATLFRGTGPGEEVGPFVSQFWLHDTPYGTQTIPAGMLVYEEKQDYLTDFDHWLYAQNTGRAMPVDGDPAFPLGRPYEFANRATDNMTNPDGTPKKKHRIVRTMRDLASFVHRDALHQAYFNAALQLAGMAKNGKINVSPTNPYVPPNGYKRMKGFGTFGDPHLLTLVSEVAARALQLQWFQKWRRHLRQRPEAFGGLVHLQFVGHPVGTKRDYHLAAELETTEAAKAIKKAHGGGLLLPMAYESGSPTHPAYGAGHATVAGACVTILKAWFDDTSVIAEPRLPPDNDETDAGKLATYQGPPLTVGGELNKLASNVAMGRSMGGVHFRTDNMRSLAIGEILATVVMGKALTHFAERHNGGPPQFRYTNFRGKSVEISLDGHRVPVVKIAGKVDPEYSKFFNRHDLAALVA